MILPIPPIADTGGAAGDAHLTALAAQAYGGGVAQLRTELRDARRQLWHQTNLRRSSMASEHRARRGRRVWQLAALAGWLLAALFAFLAAAHAATTGPLRAGPWQTACVQTICASLAPMGDGSIALELGYLARTGLPFLALVLLDGHMLPDDIAQLGLEVDGRPLEATRAVLAGPLAMVPLTEADMAALASGTALAVVSPGGRIELSLAGSASAIAAARRAALAHRPAPTSRQGEVTI